MYRRDREFYNKNKQHLRNSIDIQRRSVKRKNIALQIICKSFQDRSSQVPDEMEGLNKVG